MSEFDSFCDKIANLPLEQKEANINALTKDILPTLRVITEDDKTGIQIYINFLLAAMGADGKLSVEQYNLFKPLFDATAGAPTTYDDALHMFRTAGLDKQANYKDAVDLMVGVVGLASNDLKQSILMLCLMVCALDGSVTQKEKDWLAPLFGADTAAA